MRAEPDWFSKRTACGVAELPITRSSPATVPTHNSPWRSTCSAYTVSSLRLVGSRSLRRSEEHTSELQSRSDLVCRLLLEKKKELKPQVERSDRSGRGRRGLPSQCASRARQPSEVHSKP